MATVKQAGVVKSAVVTITAQVQASFDGCFCNEECPMLQYEMCLLSFPVPEEMPEIWADVYNTIPDRNSRILGNLEGINYPNATQDCIYKPEERVRTRTCCRLFGIKDSVPTL